MRLLVNGSNLIVGGGIQVAHSFVAYLMDHAESFVLIVGSPQLVEALHATGHRGNNRVQIIELHHSFTFENLISDSHDRLDKLVADFKIDRVFSVFGPAYWRPGVHHIVGFAKPQYIYKESPFFNQLSLKAKIRLGIKEYLHLKDFKSNADALITENQDVSDRLAQLLPSKTIHTVTNCYNQVFEQPSKWIRPELALDDHTFKILTIAHDYPHKNLGIIPEVIKQLKLRWPSFKFVFIL